MKKILIVCLIVFAGFYASAQRPFKITNSTLKLIWGADSVVIEMTGDSVYFYTSELQYVFDKDMIIGGDLTLGDYVLSTSDTIAVIDGGLVKYRLCSSFVVDSAVHADNADSALYADTAGYAPDNFWKLNLPNELTPIEALNYVNSDSCFSLDNAKVLYHDRVSNLYVGVGACETLNYDYRTFVGDSAGWLSDTNDYMTAVGYKSGYESAGMYFTGLGSNCGLSQTGSNFVGFGIDCGVLQTGDYFTGFGYACGSQNLGNYFTGSGYWCGNKQMGDYFTGSGYQCGYNQRGDYFTGLGYNCGVSQNGDYVLALGDSAGFANAFDYWTYIGKGDTNNSWINGYTGTGTKRIRLNGNVNIKNYSASASDTLLNIDNHRVSYVLASGLAVGNSALLQGWDTTNIVNYITNYADTVCLDTMHAQVYGGCSPVSVYSGDSIYYNSLKHKFNNSFDISDGGFSFGNMRKDNFSVAYDTLKSFGVMYRSDSGYYFSGIDTLTKFGLNVVIAGNRYLSDDTTNSSSQYVRDGSAFMVVGNPNSIATPTDQFSMVKAEKTQLTIASKNTYAYGGFNSYNGTQYIYNDTNAYPSLFAGIKVLGFLDKSSASFTDYTVWQSQLTKLPAALGGAENMTFGYKELVGGVAVNKSDITIDTSSIYINSDSIVIGGAGSQIKMSPDSSMSIDAKTINIFAEGNGKVTIEDNYTTLKDTVIFEKHINLKDTVSGIKIFDAVDFVTVNSDSTVTLSNVKDLTVSDLTVSGIKIYDTVDFVTVNADSTVTLSNVKDLSISGMITGVINNDGLYNKDTVMTLADDAKFEFPLNSTGFAEIQVDSLGYYMTFGNVTWSVDGTVYLKQNGAKFVGTSTDDNYACFYVSGLASTLQNRSGSSMNYIVKYHYYIP